MSLPHDLPIVDHHCHLSPDGEGVKAVGRFHAAGGTHLFLATQALGGRVPHDLEGYRAQFEATEHLAAAAERELPVRVFCVVAPYPIDLLEQASAIGLAPAEALQSEALELAATWIREERAVAIGEVGRPHFPIAPALQEAAERVFRRALEVARDVACPVVVHCEDLDAPGYRALARLASQVSFPPKRLVKHYARTPVGADARAGIAASYVARRETVRDALPQEGPWFLETDFLDDPKRPGAVLDLTTVPRRARTLLEAEPDARERLAIPFEQSVESVYGFRPVAEHGRAR